MKKIIPIYLILLFLSCSKEDDGTKSVTYQNLVGQWKFKSITRANGDVVTYQGLCPSQTDYIEILSYRKIITYNYNQDCVNTSNNGCTDYNLMTDNTFSACSFLFNDGKVTQLTNSGFRIEYAVPKPLTFMIDDITDAKVIVFEKL